MAGSPFEQALADYGAHISALEQAHISPAPEHVLAVLIARDAVHATLPESMQAPIEALLTLTHLDNRLRQHATTITQVISLADWRNSFHPPPESWWWFLAPPPPPQRWDRFDWLWNALSVVCLTIALSFVVDISGRFLSGGPDILGAFAVIGQSVLAMLAAGGALTQAGREASERILTSLRLPKHFWVEAQLGFACLLLVGIVFFYSALPWIASTYNNRGVGHYLAGRLASAEFAFSRALKLDPDAVGAHYNLGRLYEVLEDDRARAEYKAALKGGLDAAYNRVKAGRQKLETLSLPREAKTLALAYLYSGYELRAEALQTLLDAINSRSPTAAYTVAVYAMLGRLAREMRLPQEAENYYTQASQLVGKTKNIESQAAIEEGLGLVYTELQDTPKAKLWFEHAQVSYRRLGDKARLDEIAAQLERLRRP